MSKFTDFFERTFRDDGSGHRVTNGNLAKRFTMFAAGIVPAVGAFAVDNPGNNIASAADAAFAGQQNAVVLDYVPDDGGGDPPKKGQSPFDMNLSVTDAVNAMGNQSEPEEATQERPVTPTSPGSRFHSGPEDAPLVDVLADAIPADMLEIEALGTKDINEPTAAEVDATLKGSSGQKIEIDLSGKDTGDNLIQTSEFSSGIVTSPSFGTTATILDLDNDRNPETTGYEVGVSNSGGISGPMPQYSTFGDLSEALSFAIHAVDNGSSEATAVAEKYMPGLGEMTKEIIHVAPDTGIQTETRFYENNNGVYSVMVSGITDAPGEKLDGNDVQTFTIKHGETELNGTINENEKFAGTYSIGGGKPVAYAPADLGDIMKVGGNAFGVGLGAEADDGPKNNTPSRPASGYKAPGR